MVRGEGHAFRPKIYVPEGLQREIFLKQVHGPLLVGHPTAPNMLKILSAYAWWPSMEQDVTNFYLKCERCQREREGKTLDTRSDPVRPAAIPFSGLQVDVKVLPVTRNGNIYIYVAVDFCNKDYYYHKMFCKKSIIYIY